MITKVDFSIATSEQIEEALCHQLVNIRLCRNWTQQQLARRAGVSLKTISRLEKGEGVSLNTFIRVLIALGFYSHLQNLLPDPNIRPIERTKFDGVERKRARPPKTNNETKPWVWGDEKPKG